MSLTQNGVLLRRIEAEPKPLLGRRLRLENDLSEDQIERATFLGHSIELTF